MFNIFKKNIKYRNQIQLNERLIFIPGEWVDNKKPSSECILAIKSDYKELYINDYPFKDKLPDDKVQKYLLHMVKLRLDAEGNMGGGGTIVDQKIDYWDKVKWCKYYRTVDNPTTSAYCKIIACDKGIITMYIVYNGKNLKNCMDEIAAIAKSFN